MTKPRIIGLYSSAPQSGKTTTADELQAKGFVVVSFASPLKRMLTIFLSSAGYGQEQIEGMLFDHKEERIPEFGVSARHLMQTLGSEWGRDCIHPDVWVRVWKNNVRRWLDGGVSVVVDDVRFANEWQAVKDLGGECWYITRPRTPKTTQHISEGALDNHGFDQRLTNDGSVEDLRNRVGACLEQRPAEAIR